MPTTPAPIIIETSGDFDGNDGPWSSFLVRLGNPAQELRLLASTQVPETWVVGTEGCTLNDPQNCDASRGGLFNSTASSSWNDSGVYSLNAEINLGYTQNSDNGDYALDTIEVGTPGDGAVSLGQQVVAGIATKDFYLGNLGLSTQPIALSNTGEPLPSLLSSLMSNNLIPSRSYGYTAGASYRNATASLTLGGFDASRLVANDVSFTFAPAVTRELVVALQSIIFTDSKTPETPLLAQPIMTLVDSTIPHIWLPLTACQAFEESFKITYDPITNYYLVNDTLHETLKAQNASVTFQLGNTFQGGANVNITLPYASFDLEVSSPIVNNTSYYFPLRRAYEDISYTLGRTFLQESFLIVDNDRSNFSISRSLFPPDSHAHIIPILSDGTSTGAGTGSGTSTGTSTVTSANTGPKTDATATSTNPSQTAPVIISHNVSHSLSTAALAGIAIAIVTLSIIGVSLAIFWALRRRRLRKSPHLAELPGEPTHAYVDEKAAKSPFASVLPNNELKVRVSEVQEHEIDGREMPEIAIIELDGEEVPRSELASPDPGWRSSGIPSLEPDSTTSQFSLSEFGLRRVPAGMQMPEMPSLGYGAPSPDILSTPGVPSPELDFTGQALSPLDPGFAMSEVSSPGFDSPGSEVSSPGFGFTMSEVSSPDPDSHRSEAPSPDFGFPRSGLSSPEFDRRSVD